MGVILAVLGFFDSFTYSESGAVDMRGHTNVSIVLTDDGFRPERLIVDKGTTLVFTTNRDKPFWPASNQHPSHMLYPEFDPLEPIARDASWSFVMNKAGVRGYHDHIRSYYMGVVYVH